MPGESSINAVQNRAGGSWTKRDYIATAMGTLAYLVDTIEIYLPGIVTQAVACDLNLTKLKKGWLCIVMYLFVGVAAMITGKIVTRIGRRNIVLVSLYVSIACNLIPLFTITYELLLFSRCLIGICIGLNCNVINIFFTSQLSSPEIKAKAQWINVTFNKIGAIWVAVLGYLLIYSVGWRVFMVSSSIPLVVPTLILVHFGSSSNDNQMTTTAPDEQQELLIREKIVPRNLCRKTVKLCILNAANKLQIRGAILLFPDILRYLTNNHKIVTDPCEGALHLEFLAIAFVSGVPAIIGALIQYQIQRRTSMFLRQTFQSLILVICYGVFLLSQQEVIKLTWAEIILLMFLINVTGMAIAFDIRVLLIDETYLGTDTIDKNGSYVTASGNVGVAIGLAVTAFGLPFEIYIMMFTTSVICVLVVFSMRKERS